MHKPDTAIFDNASLFVNAFVQKNSSLPLPGTMNNVAAHCVHTDSFFCPGWVENEAFDLNSEESC